MHHRFRWVAVLVFALSGLGPLVSSSAAQTPTFAVEGTVTDDQQAVLPGATVTVRRCAFSSSGETTRHGRFFRNSLPRVGSSWIR